MAPCHGIGVKLRFFLLNINRYKNSKFEYRNSKQIQMTKIQMAETKPLRDIFKTIA
jgi:hypothetical protein